METLTPITGIWDCQSSQAVVEFVRRGIAAKQPLAKICENMMDNCLASNSETGGVGCDNMTMIVIGLLHGKTEEQWYAEIAKRVANGDGPCAPPEYGKSFLLSIYQSALTLRLAEFRGPGVHHNFDDSDSGYDVDPESTGKGKQFGGNSRGRIILLGDGTEVLTDSDDTEMFGEEDKDLAAQVHKGQITGQAGKEENKEPQYKGVADSKPAEKSTEASKK